MSDTAVLTDRERYSLPKLPFPMKPLTLADTCDYCGPFVSAYVQVRVNSGGELRFCGHCYTVHEATFIAAGYEIKDERDRLIPAINTHKD